MKIGIFGLPNSGKSQLRRWLVTHLRDSGLRVEHWDADRFDKARCPEDEDMKEPPERFLGTIWLVEDVRGTMAYAHGNGGKKGPCYPMNYYDHILYLSPDWPTYAAFWVSRALRWQKNGQGNWARDKGWEELADEQAIMARVFDYLERRETLLQDDMRVLPPATQLIIPCLQGQKITWQGLMVKDGPFSKLFKGEPSLVL